MQQPGKQPVRILIADDHLATRQALRMALQLCPDIEVVGEAADGLEAVRLAEQLQPDVVLMDGKMPIMDGLEATRLIKSQWPAIRVIVHTMCPEFQAQAIAAGADVSLPKDARSFDLVCDIVLRPRYPLIG